MPKTPFSLLLLRRPLSHKPYPLRSHAFSSSSIPNPKPSSLSARMSFVFDQVDAMEAAARNQNSSKDEALQRIRAWRESKNANNSPFPKHDPAPPESEISGPPAATAGSENARGLDKINVEFVHPWKEWVELMERLVQQNYFDLRRKDEEGMLRDSGFDMADVADEGFDFTRDFKTVQTACLNFGRDRFDILRSLSRQDIQLLVGNGCPNVDKKAIFSAKVLRKLVHIDEGDVCSSCTLRNSCEKAYLLTNKEDEARTIDVMRILLAFGLDPVKETVTNKSLLKLKSTKTVVRKLLHEVVKLSAIPIDPNLPPPIIKRPPPKVKQPPPAPKKRVGRDDIEMKKGDWLCTKCDFMNFAKNIVCLQCDAKKPKRQLLPGEWECPECNFLNYRRNMVCFHCECKRPSDGYMENDKLERQHTPNSDRQPIRQEVSNAWNFDFDDAESDGADVAAFEYADSPRMDQEMNGPAEGQHFREPEADNKGSTMVPRHHEGRFPNAGHKRSKIGFNDFDDEDDDVDSYELDCQNSSPGRNGFSEVKNYSVYKDVESSDDDLPTRSRSGSSSMQQRQAVSGFSDDIDFESDEDLPVHPNWRSSHVADSRPKNRARRACGPSRGMNSHSDGEFSLSSDSDDVDLHKDGEKWGSGGREFRKVGSGRKPFYGSDSNDDDGSSPNNRFRGSKTSLDQRRGTSKGREIPGRTRDTDFRSNGKIDGRSKSFDDDFDRSQGYNGKNRVYQGNRYGGRNKNTNRDNGCDKPQRQMTRGKGREYGGNDYSGRRFDNHMGKGYGSDDRPGRHVIERGEGRRHGDGSNGGQRFDNHMGKSYGSDDRPRRRVTERGEGRRYGDGGGQRFEERDYSRVRRRERIIER